MSIDQQDAVDRVTIQCSGGRGVGWMNTLASSLLATPDLMVDMESARLCILYVEVAVNLLLLREVFN